MMGGSLLRTTCVGQALIALSSGEAEFYGLVSACSETLSDQSLMSDWGIKVPIRIHMDATAGAAIGSRRGIGRVKHLSTCFLWVQDYVTRGAIKLLKVHTTENLADMLTKPVVWTIISKTMQRVHLRLSEGRSKLAYSA